MNKKKKIEYFSARPHPSSKIDTFVKTLNTIIYRRIEQLCVVLQSEMSIFSYRIQSSDPKFSRAYLDIFIFTPSLVFDHFEKPPIGAY